MGNLATAAARLNARNRRNFPGAAFLPPLLAMTDDRRLPDPTRFLAAFPPGAALICRGRGGADRLAAASDLRRACAKRRIAFVWAGDAADAIAIGADGLHLRDDAATRARECRTWRRRRGNAPVFAAAHSAAAIRACARLGVDAVLVSPVFPTASHPGQPCLGITRFRAWARQAGLPVYALGGVTPRTLPGLAVTSCVGIAGIDWVLALHSA